MNIQQLFLRHIGMMNGWYFGRRTSWQTVQFLLILGDQGDVGEGCDEDEEEDFFNGY
jgi:hypothetical protein